MKYLMTASMALKAIFSNKMRSFLTMLGIIIGVSSVIILVTLVNGVNQKQMESWYSMGQNTVDVYYSSWKRDLTDELYDYCLSLSDYVSGITPKSQTNGNFKYRSKTVSDSQLYFGNNEFSTCTNYKIASGRDINYADVKNRVQVAVIGERIRKELFGAENPVGKTIKIKGRNFTVIGVYEARSDGSQWSQDDMAVVPYTLMRSLTGSTLIDNYIVKARDAASTQKVIDEITSFLSTKFNEDWYYSVYSENQWTDMYNESNRMASMIVGGIAGISLLVGGIGIMNIMLVSVTERTREIGIRSAIGARRRDIIMQFLIESAVISASGGLIGILVGAIGSAIGGAAIIKEPIMPSPPIIIGAFLFSVCLGVFFGFYPANKASKLQPVEALRAQ